MALPATIWSGASNIDWCNNYGTRLGPWAIGSNLYVLAMNTSSNVLLMYRSTDGGNTWAEVDSAHHPTGLVASSPFDAVLVGSTIHVVYVSSTNNLIIRTFASDLWGTASAAGPAFGGSTGGLCGCNVAIGVRSNGDRVVAYQSAVQNISGTNYDRTSVVVYTTAWGTAISLSTGLSTHINLHAMLIGSSDRVHMLYGKSTTVPQGLYHRSIDSSNSPDTEQIAVASNLYSVSTCWNPVGVPVLNGTQVCFTYAGADFRFYMVRFTSGANPTFAQTQVSATQVDANNDQAGVALVLGSTVYVVFSDNTGLDIFEKDDGGTNTWGADGAAKATTQAYGVSANFVSSTKIGYIWRDETGTPYLGKYNEVTVVASGPQTVTVGSVSSQSAFGGVNKITALPPSLTSQSAFGAPSVTLVLAGGPGAISFVAMRASANITTAAVNTSFGISGVTAGNYLIALVAIGSQAGGLSSITDNKGNTWTVRQNVAGTLSSAGYAFVDCKVTTGGAITITLNFSASIKAAWYILEFSGLHATAWYDTVSASKTNATGSTAPVTNALTPAAAGELTLAVFSAGAWTSGSPGAGYTSAGAPLNSGPDHYGEYDLSANAGSQTATATVAPANIYSGGLIAYKPVVVVGSITINPASLPSQSAFGGPSPKQNIITAVGSLASQSTIPLPTAKPGAVSCSPASLASQSNIPTPGTAVSGQVVSPTSLASQSSFGTITIKTVVTVSPTALGSQSAFGTVTQKSNVTAIVSAVGNAPSFGVPTALPGNATRAVTALGSQSTFGTSLSFSQRTAPLTGPASQSAFGVPTKTTGGTTRTVTALTSQSAFGTPVGVPGPRVIPQTALASQSAFGFPLPLAGNRIVTVASLTSQSAVPSPGAAQRTPPLTGIPSQSAFGSVVIKTNIVRSPASLTSASAFGTVTTTLTGGGTQTVAPASLASQSSFGTALAKAGNVITTVGSVASQSAFSPPPVANQRVAVPSVATAQAFGSITLRILAAPASLGSQSAFGVVTRIPGNASRTPPSLASASSFGAVGTGGSSLIVVGSVTTAQVFGAITPRPGNVTRSPASLTTASALGAAIALAGNVIKTPASLPSQSVFGLPQTVGGSAKVTPPALQSSGAFGTITAKAGNTVVNLTGLSIPSAAQFGGIYQPSSQTVAAIIDKWRHEKRERGVMV